MPHKGGDHALNKVIGFAFCVKSILLRNLVLNIYIPSDGVFTKLVLQE